MSDHHEAHPHDFGPTVQMLGRRRPAFPASAVAFVLAAMVEEGTVIPKGRFYRLTAHIPEFSLNDQRRWRQVCAAMEAMGMRPPQMHELARALEWEPKTLQAFLRRAEQVGLVSLAAPRRYFTNATLMKLAICAQEIVNANPKGSFTVAEFSRHSATGRNLAVNILEYFDRIGLTRRYGNARTFKEDIGTHFFPVAIEIEQNNVDNTARKGNASGDARGLQIR